MSKFLIVVFDNRQAAYEGSRALLELDRQGSIALYAGLLISRNHQGQVRVEDGIDDGPVATAAGALLGGLIGAIGGPEMMAIGTLGGATGGWIGDLYSVGVDAQFLNEVGTALAPGKFAVVADASEGWTTTLDHQMHQIGGSVFRRNRIDVEDAQIERDIEATQRDLDDLLEEWGQAVGDVKQALQQKADAARDRLVGLRARAGQKVQQLETETSAKLNKLGEQIARATGEAKFRFEQRRDEIVEEYESRTKQLKEAEAFTANSAD